MILSHFIIKNKCMRRLFHKGSKSCLLGVLFLSPHSLSPLSTILLLHHLSSTASPPLSMSSSLLSPPADILFSSASSSLLSSSASSSLLSHPSPSLFVDPLPLSPQHLSLYHVESLFISLAACFPHSHVGFVSLPRRMPLSLPRKSLFLPFRMRISLSSLVGSLFPRRISLSLSLLPHLSSLAGCLSLCPRRNSLSFSLAASLSLSLARTFFSKNPLRVLRDNTPFFLRIL